MYVSPNRWSCRTLHGKINVPNRFHCKPHPVDEGFKLTHMALHGTAGLLLGMEGEGLQSAETSLSKGVCWGENFLAPGTGCQGGEGCGCPGVTECSQELSLLRLSLSTGRAGKASPWEHRAG